MSRFTWREYFLLIGILIIWIIAGFAGLQALGEADIMTTGLSLFIGVLATGILLILIAIIERIL